ncbi:hypothetical protein [Rhodococcus koreensis]
MGRPHKGTRKCISVRAPLQQHSFYEARAEELGLELGDYALLVMARAYNLDVPDYILKKLDPEKLRAHDERYAACESSDSEYSISA